MYSNPLHSEIKGADWYGFCYRVGLLTGYGMSFIFDFISANQFYLQLLGSIVLFVFGVYTFRSNPVNSLRPASPSKGTYLHNFITAFAVTLSNPLIIFLFIGLFARFTFIAPQIHLYEKIVGYLSIALGAFTWWFLITFIVSKLRTRFNVRGIWVINRTIGVVVMVLSVLGLIFTFFGKPLY